MVEKQNRPRRVRRAVFCHHGSDTVQNSPVSSGVNSYSARIFLGVSSASPRFELVPLKLRRAVLFRIGWIERRQAKRETSSMSDEETSCNEGILATLEAAAGEFFQIRSNELLKA
jgi:hypothetical protein